MKQVNLISGTAKKTFSQKIDGKAFIHLYLSALPSLPLKIQQRQRPPTTTQIHILHLSRYKSLLFQVVIEHLKVAEKDVCGGLESVGSGGRASVVLGERFKSILYPVVHFWSQVLSFPHTHTQTTENPICPVYLEPLLLQRREALGEKLWGDWVSFLHI